MEHIEFRIVRSDTIEVYSESDTSENFSIAKRSKYIIRKEFESGVHLISQSFLTGRTWKIQDKERGIRGLIRQRWSLLGKKMELHLDGARYEVTPGHRNVLSGVASDGNETLFRSDPDHYSSVNFTHLEVHNCPADVAAVSVLLAYRYFDLT